MLNMNKRGISPLVSTIVLIMISIGIGFVVMNWGRTQLGEGARCAVDAEMKVVKLNGVPQVCYSGSGESGFIKILIENGANVDVGSLLVTIIGSKQPYNIELKDSAIEKGYTLQKEVPYNFDLFGKVKQVKIAPKIITYPGEPSLLCPEQSLIIAGVRPC